MTWVRCRRASAATALLAAAVTAGLLAGSSAASAAPGDPGTDIGGAATGSAPTVDNTRWPAALNWVIPGTPEFTERYLSGRTAGGEPALAGCTATEGGDAWAYTRDFFTQLGAVLDAQATATGQPVMALGDAPIRTAPWPGLATDRGTTVGQDAGGGEVSATPGTLIPMPDSGGAVDNGVGICADTLRRFGTPAANTPFGFGFYQAPDQGSIDFLMEQLAAQPTPAPSGGASFVNSARYYQRGSGTVVDAWDFSPLDVTGYCADENNPFCLTAAFLRCPGGNGQTDAEAAAITACRTWNANVIILNQYIAMTLLTPGVGVGADGALDPLQAVATPGAQAPLDSWTGLAVAGATLTESVRMFYVTLGASVLIGGLIAGGLPGLLIAAGVVGAAALVSSQGLFGAVSCATDLPRCLAAAGSDGLLKSLSLIPDAAKSAPVPEMTSASWRELLGALGGISAALLLLFFLISLLASVVQHRPAALWPAFFGLITWGAAMGLGGLFLTLFIRARDGAITVLSGSGGGASVLQGFTGAVTDSLTAIAADPSPGFLLAGLLCLVGMVLAAVVWLVVWVASQWVPLVVALLVLQTAGQAAPGMPRKWLSRGFSVLWTLLLTPPMVILIWRVGMLGLESNTGYIGLLLGVLVLLGCGFAFLVVPRMLPMGEGSGLGLGAAFLSAASWVAGRASSAARRNPSRDQLNRRQLDTAPDDPGAAGGGNPGGGEPTGPRPGGPGTAALDPDPNQSAGAGTSGGAAADRRGWAGTRSRGSRSGPNTGGAGREPQEPAEKNAAAPDSGRPAAPTEPAVPPPGGTSTRTTRTGRPAGTASSPRDRVDGGSTPPAGRPAGPAPGLVPAR